MLWNASWFKRNAPSKKHHYLSGVFERVAVMLSVTKSHNTGKWPTNHLQGHIKPSEHINKYAALVSRSLWGARGGISTNLLSGEVFRSMASEMLLRSQRKLHHAFQELVRRQADEVVHDELLGV